MGQNNWYRNGIALCQIFFPSSPYQKNPPSLEVTRKPQNLSRFRGHSPTNVSFYALAFHSIIYARFDRIFVLKIICIYKYTYRFIHFPRIIYFVNNCKKKFDTSLRVWPWPWFGITMATQDNSAARARVNSDSSFGGSNSVFATILTRVRR